MRSHAGGRGVGTRVEDGAQGGHDSGVVLREALALPELVSPCQLRPQPLRTQPQRRLQQRLPVRRPLARQQLRQQTESERGIVVPPKFRTRNL
ncbi:Protein of unknown function [Gryllus bimaculatus]|nr:Protein of unknown function [Gryllus bimaculatus]